MLYITLLDQFHPGIYKSQVIDVCKYLSSESELPVTLVSFLSIREMLRSDSAKSIKKLYDNSIVLPAFPGLGNYRYTQYLLGLLSRFKGEKLVLARNAFAASTAIDLRRRGVLTKVGIDVRSSLTAEIHEYDAFPNPKLRAEVLETERKAILEADFRIGVSNQMVEHWRNEYGYSSDKHVVIPCTLNRDIFKDYSLERTKVQSKRSELGIDADDVVLIFSGSNAPWQGESLKNQVLNHYLIQEKHKLLFLSKPNDLIDELMGKYPNKVQRYWLSHEKVPEMLQVGDYGLLLREQSVTNKVASPAKFAEYLAAGMHVLISENLGDFSGLVKKNSLGFVVKENSNLPSLRRRSFEEKLQVHEFARAHFSKSKYSSEYQQFIENLS